MKLNPDCVRLVLLDLEERLKPNDMISVYTYVNSFDLPPKISIDDVIYTIEKMYEARFLELNEYDSIDNLKPECLSANILSITYEGHKFLDTIRDDTAWGNIKKKLINAGVFTLQTIVETTANTAISAGMSALM